MNGFKWTFKKSILLSLFLFIGQVVQSTAPSQCQWIFCVQLVSFDGWHPHVYGTCSAVSQHRQWWTFGHDNVCSTIDCSATIFLSYHSIKQLPSHRWTVDRKKLADHDHVLFAKISLDMVLQAPLFNGGARAKSKWKKKNILEMYVCFGKTKNTFKNNNFACK